MFHLCTLENTTNRVQRDKTGVKRDAAMDYGLSGIVCPWMLWTQIIQSKAQHSLNSLQQITAMVNIFQHHNNSCIFAIFAKQSKNVDFNQ